MRQPGGERLQPRGGCGPLLRAMPPRCRKAAPAGPAPPPVLRRGSGVSGDSPPDGPWPASSTARVISPSAFGGGCHGVNMIRAPPPAGRTQKNRFPAGRSARAVRTLFRGYRIAHDSLGGWSPTRSAGARNRAGEVATADEHAEQGNVLEDGVAARSGSGGKAIISFGHGKKLVRSAICQHGGGGVGRRQTAKAPAPNPRKNTVQFTVARQKPTTAQRRHQGGRDRHPDVSVPSASAGSSHRRPAERPKTAPRTGRTGWAWWRAANFGRDRLDRRTGYGTSAGHAFTRAPQDPSGAHQGRV